MPVLTMQGILVWMSNSKFLEYNLRIYMFFFNLTIIYSVSGAVEHVNTEYMTRRNKL